MIFDAAGIKLRNDFQPPVSGQRRTLVEQYYASLDFFSSSDTQKLVTAFEELIDQLSEANAQTTIEGLLRRMERDGFRYDRGRFHSEFLGSFGGVEASTLISLTEVSISEHVEKARSKIEADDYSGAISSAYTLVEGFLRELLHRTGTTFNHDEGDIRELYKALSEPLGLNPAGESLESYLRAILQGLKNQISGFYELANKAGDRHTRRYHPAKHHSKLAVNAAFTLCEFLLGSYEYQRQKKSFRSASG